MPSLKRRSVLSSSSDDRSEEDLGQGLQGVVDEAPGLADGVPLNGGAEPGAVALQQQGGLAQADGEVEGGEVVGQLPAQEPVPPAEPEVEWPDLGRLRGGLFRGSIRDRIEHYRDQVRPFLARHHVQPSLRGLVDHLELDQGNYEHFRTLSALCTVRVGDQADFLQREAWGWLGDRGTQDLLLQGDLAHLEHHLRGAVLQGLAADADFVERLFDPGELGREAFNSFMGQVHRHGIADLREVARERLEAGVEGEARVRAGQLATGVPMPLREGRGDPVVERDWKGKHVDRLVEVIDGLPEAHTAGNDRLQGVVRAPKDKRHDEDMPWGWYVANQPSNRDRERHAYIGGNSKSFATTDWLRTNLRGRPKARQLAGPDDPMRVVQSRFDHVLRHEIGHAVDALLGASTTYGTTPQGGGWETLAGVEAVVAATREPFLDGCQELLPHFADHDLERAPEEVLVDALRGALQGDGRVHRHLDGVAGWERLPRRQRKAIREALAGLDAEARVRSMCKGTHAIDDAENPGFGDDGFHRTDGTWYRYLLAARDRKVTRYQFHAPSEWFAEAYAAFYEEEGGAVLKGADPVTWAWFTTAVHDAGVALQLDRVQQAVAALQERFDDGGEEGLEALVAQQQVGAEVEAEV